MTPDDAEKAGAVLECGWKDAVDAVGQARAGGVYMLTA